MNFILISCMDSPPSTGFYNQNSLQKAENRNAKKDQQPHRVPCASVIGHILQESVMFLTGSVSTNRGLWKMLKREKRAGLALFQRDLSHFVLRQMSPNPVTHIGWQPALKCTHWLHKGLKQRENEKHKTQLRVSFPPFPYSLKIHLLLNLS